MASLADPMMKLQFFSFFAIVMAWSPTVWAGALADAKIGRFVNQVRVADATGSAHLATTEEIVHGGSAILTGAHARTEATFPDQTLIRLGAESDVRLRAGSREVGLVRGTLLVEVPSFRGDARVHTGSITSSFGSATALIEHLPGKSLKIVVLEGSARVAVDGFLGDSIVLTPGKMLITTLDVRRLPDPVDVDLSTLAKTSSLIDPATFRGSSKVIVAALPRWAQIEKEIGRQARLLKGKALFPTNLVIMGSGTSVTIPGNGRPSGAADATPSQVAQAPAEPEGVTAVTRRRMVAARPTGEAAEESEVPLSRP